MRISTLLAAIAATAVTTTACKKTPKPPPEEESASSGATGKRLDWTLDELKTVNTTSPVQGIMLWAQELDYYGKEVEHAVMLEVGTRCLSGGPAAEDCAKSWRLIVEEQQKANRRVYAIVTKGVDRHELVTEEAQLKALLGPIDTPGEAALLAGFVGASKVYVPQCDGFSRTIVMEQASPSGYSMKLQKRVRKGDLKGTNGPTCTDCIIVESRDAVVRPSGAVELSELHESEWFKPTGCGRSPGWSYAISRRPRTAGEWLAYAAHLEAASVAAFERIAEELVALEAPPELVARARQAAIEEEAHARIAAELARARGVEPEPFIANEYELRSAFDLALDNAVEGCVNETYGALVLHVQALTAEDGALRAAFAAISEDEGRHAELSFDLARWLDARLSEEERSAVARAATDARAVLATELDRSALDASARRRLGLPDRATSRALYDAMPTTS